MHCEKKSLSCTLLYFQKCPASEGKYLDSFSCLQPSPDHVTLFCGQCLGQKNSKKGFFILTSSDFQKACKWPTIFFFVLLSYHSESYSKTMQKLYRMTREMSSFSHSSRLSPSSLSLWWGSCWAPAWRGWRRRCRPCRCRRRCTRWTRRWLPGAGEKNQTFELFQHICF